MHTSCPAVTMGATGLRRLCGSWIWRLRPASERSARRRTFTRTRNRRNPSCAAGRSARSCCVRICRNKRRRFASVRRCSSATGWSGLRACTVCAARARMSCCSKCRFMRGRSLSGTRCISCWICRIYKLSSHTPSAIRLRTSSSWRATVCRCSSMPRA